MLVRCRTGSLEIYAILQIGAGVCSLPHRQLRNLTERAYELLIGSLPHRQLRKIFIDQKLLTDCSLPHRQLRKAA